VQALIVAAVSAIALVASANPMHTDEVFVPERPRPPPPPPPPKPAAEIAATGKLVAGAWKCTGAVDKLDITVALDNAWIEWRVTGGAGTTLQFRTFDKTAKQWTMLELTSVSAHHEASSLGDDKGSWTWAVGDDHREHETLAKDKIELWGERRAGAGWHKNYEATCRRAK
jgi:hypothetical protein